MRILLCLLLLSLARAFLSLYPSSTLSHNSFSETRPIHTGHDRRLCSHGSSHPARKCHVRYRRDNGAAIKLRVADRQQQENVKEESFDISEPPYDNGTTIQSSNVPTKSESPPAAATKETLDDKANYSGEAKMSLDQLKDTVDIVRVVESFHLPGFVRRGEGAVAICPFHEDRNPSLSVDGKRKIFKCFACGAGGDVFRFVQEYSKLPDNNNIALSFGEVVQYISTTFSDGSMGGGGTRRAILNQQLEMERHRKDRIRLANAAASDFYSQCLLQPTAGGARHHLLSRGLSAAAVRSFALGYAPDVYYNNPKNKYPSDWGLGSLVHRLRDLGFSPREVLNSGLATRTKRSLVRNDKATTIDLATNDTVQASEEDYLDYSMLMDRFRGRLMVPIFGKYGKNVVGFGGRSIQSPDSSVDDGEAVSGFKAPKYINSPESEVFEKRNNLFGLNAIQSATKVSSRDSGLILVEGYMDAISLWHAGVENVVATMGTAVAKEQLQLAASTARTLGFRRIIICMDSDDAGNSAVLRLCKNGLLSDCAKTNAIAIEVARLPDGVKDPAEFIEFRREMGSNLTQAADDFRRDVISSSVDWIEWFLQVVVKEYNSEAPSGSTGSFSSIFDTVADFLATSLHPADRAKYAYNAVEQMSGILRQERNLTEIPLVLMYQLEEDMIDATSKISNTKTAISRRTESNDNAVFALVRGHGPTSSEEDNKLSKKSRGKIKGADELTSAKHINDPPSFTQSKGREKRMPTRAILKRHVDLPEESLMPHFAGFRFVHETDNEWLGINRNTKVRTVKFQLYLSQDTILS